MTVTPRSAVDVKVSRFASCRGKSAVLTSPVVSSLRSDDQKSLLNFNLHAQRASLQSSHKTSSSQNPEPKARKREQRSGNSNIKCNDSSIPAEVMSLPLLFVPYSISVVRVKNSLSGEMNRILENSLSCGSDFDCVHSDYSRS
ncbi:uncharacterized protein RAG0_11235 [Rhynchosporium agropyri]|uniref:Uncharacterized protein n=1 Tax=Rhynchosporium agropyri TaxID=914238 RepID=A0A1E1L3J4_9HELO|nr:uncharacterized protein RAG0_11235 [Rhynchosporium agropyri]